MGRDSTVPTFLGPELCVHLIGRSPILERQAVIFAAGEINKIKVTRGMDATCGKNDNSNGI